MTPVERDDLTLAIALVALAGFVDAVGFLMLRVLFVSFMSGNSTQFAIHAGQADASAAAQAGAIVSAFVAGVVAGRLLGIAAGPWRRTALLGLVSAGLALAAGLPAPPLACGAVMAFAMGAQNGVVHAVGRTTTGLTYITGALVKLGEALADAATGAGPASAPWPYLALWLAIVAGGVAGAVAWGEFGIAALVLPAVAAGLLAAATAARRG